MTFGNSPAVTLQSVKVQPATAPALCQQINNCYVIFCLAGCQRLYRTRGKSNLKLNAKAASPWIKVVMEVTKQKKYQKFYSRRVL